MVSKSKKLIIAFSFLILFFGSAGFMYFKYIHNKPKIKIIAPKTEVDPMKFDSLLYEQNKDRQLK